MKSYDDANDPDARPQEASAKAFFCHGHERWEEPPSLDEIVEKINDGLDEAESMISNIRTDLNIGSVGGAFIKASSLALGIEDTFASLYDFLPWDVRSEMHELGAKIMGMPGGGYPNEDGSGLVFFGEITEEQKASLSEMWEASRRTSEVRAADHAAAVEIRGFEGFPES